MRGQRRYIALAILMGVTLGVELWAELCHREQRPFLWLYNVFVIIEYSLLCWYFIGVTTRTVIRRFIGWSIPVFAAISIVLSFQLYNFTQFPGQNINIEGMLITVLCVSVLFNLDSRLYRNITRHPDFWICCGWLVFYAGTFLSNGLLTYLMNQNLDYAERVFEILNRPLNLILYSCLIVGLICALLRR